MGQRRGLLPARDGAEESLRRSRTKENKRLRSWRRSENEETGFQIEQRNEGGKMRRAC
jgi:hypothetical protein